MGEGSGWEGRQRPIRSYFVVDRVPAGEAPLEIREKWVGLPLAVRYDRPVEAPDPLVGAGIVSRQVGRVDDGVRIRLADCLDALTRAGRSGAAAYWEVTLGAPFAELGFQASEGRLITVDLAERLFPDLGA